MKIKQKNITKILMLISTILIIIVIFYFFNKNIKTEHFYAVSPPENNNKTNPLNLPLRYQWNTNYGYCGEVCFITAGLMLGQYFSQYDLRKIAHCTYDNACGCNNNEEIPDDCKIQGDKDTSQLLLGINDDKISTVLHFNYEQFDVQNNPTKYVDWIKKNLAKKNIIVSAVYENFGDKFFKAWNTNIDSEKDKFGDPEYDHIILITNLTKDYLYINDLGNYQNYLIDATDNSRYNEQNFYDSADYKNIQYIFQIPITSKGVKNRVDANKDKTYPYIIPKSVNYAISISGLKDKYNNKPLISLSIKVDKNYELPRVVEGSNNSPTPMNLQLIVTASNLIKGKKYRILKFDNITKVTDKKFNIIEKNASNNFKFLENGNVTDSPIEFSTNIDTYSFIDNISSLDQAIYRGFEI